MFSRFTLPHQPVLISLPPFYEEGLEFPFSQPQMSYSNCPIGLFILSIVSHSFSHYFPSVLPILLFLYFFLTLLFQYSPLPLDLVPPSLPSFLSLSLLFLPSSSLSFLLSLHLSLHFLPPCLPACPCTGPWAWHTPSRLESVCGGQVRLSFPPSLLPLSHFPNADMECHWSSNTNKPSNWWNSAWFPFLRKDHFYSASCIVGHKETLRSISLQL